MFFTLFLFYRCVDRFCLSADEKEKYDPIGFRDSVLAGFNEAGDDLESIYKYLDVAGSKLDYRRYGEALFDILIAGGLLGEFAFIFFSLLTPFSRLTIVSSFSFCSSGGLFGSGCSRQSVPHEDVPFRRPGGFDGAFEGMGASEFPVGSFESPVSNVTISFSPIRCSRS